jgi:hypothetical protein
MADNCRALLVNHQWKQENKKEDEKQDDVKNKLSYLNDHLFTVIERLNNDILFGDTVSDEKLNREINRSDAITRAAAMVIASSNLIHKAHVTSIEWEPMTRKKLPKVLG